MFTIAFEFNKVVNSTDNCVCPYFRPRILRLAVANIEIRHVKSSEEQQLAALRARLASQCEDRYYICSHIFM